MNNGTREQIDRITHASSPMKKFDVAALKGASEEKCVHLGLVGMCKCHPQIEAADRFTTQLQC